MWSRLLHYYQSYQHFIDRHSRVVGVILVAYLVILVVAMLWLNISITPDRLALALLVAAAGLGQVVRFVRDWVPFMAILVIYESLRGFADNLTHEHINITNLIAADRWLFAGHVPTIWLQDHLYSAGVLHWYDWMGTILYFLHFPLPVFLAFYLWRSDLVKYWQFVLSFMLLCLSGFVTYFLFPAAPPWWAAKEQYLPAVTKIIDRVLDVFPQQMSISYMYSNLNPNPVAAMPSLHAAFPWLVFLTLWQVFGRRALWFLPYCFALWFSIVYLGEHYIVDALAGILYASAAFWLGHGLFRWVTQYRKSKLLLQDDIDRRLTETMQL